MIDIWDSHLSRYGSWSPENGSEFSKSYNFYKSISSEKKNCKLKDARSCILT